MCKWHNMIPDLIISPDCSPPPTKLPLLGKSRFDAFSKCGPGNLAANRRQAGYACSLIQYTYMYIASGLHAAVH